MRNFLIFDKSIMTFVLCSLLFSSHALYAQNTINSEEPLLGIWVSEKATRGGFKSILEFNKNGVIIHRKAIMLDYRYHVENNSITVFSTGDKTEETVEETGRIIIKNGVMELQFGKGEPKSLIRKDNLEIPINAKYIGQWSSKEPSGISEYYIFDRKENLHIRIPMPGKTIRVFSITGDIIKIRNNPVKTKENSFVVMDKTIEKYIMKWNIDKNEILTLTDSSDKIFTYEKFRE